MISSNRLFCSDFITEGWTEKDWALNLLPLGGVASVAYEIGYPLCTRDRTTKISQDFFKSPILTTIKKMAQCLWVPIVICGARKLVSLTVNACWNNCFPLLTYPKAKDPCETIPKDVILGNFFLLKSP